jgi:hypothetical protein
MIKLLRALDTKALHQTLPTQLPATNADKFLAAAFAIALMRPAAAPLAVFVVSAVPPAQPSRPRMTGFVPTPRIPSPTPSMSHCKTSL